MPEESLLVIQRARQNLVDFEIATDPKYNPNWHHDSLGRELEHIEKFGDRDYKILLVFEPPRHGKEISNSELVLTIDGWKTHGELKIGDCVFGINGKSVKVVSISQKTRSNCVVMFTNGEKIECHENHEWTVLDRSYNVWKTYETNHFLKKTKFGKDKQTLTSGRCMYYLPRIEPLEFKEKDLIINPYVLGAWLGDGTSSAPVITGDVKDYQIIDAVKECYPISSINIHKTTGCLTTRFGSGSRRASLFGNHLRSLGVFNNKHIPLEYKFSSIEQRLQLLAGLIDTDGNIDKNSRVRIVTVSKKLANDIDEVIRSLGWNSYITEQKPTLSSSGIQGKKIVYSIGFNPTKDIPTRLPRKKIKRFPPQRMIGIKSVSRIENGEMGHCITVDSPDGLYLVGKKFIPTHNSQQISIDFPAWYLGRNPNKEIITASYSADLAQDFGGKTREKVNSEEYQYIFPNVILREDEKSRGKWRTKQGGSYTAVGVGGPITGRGADILLIDDPIKNREEAESEIYRNKIWDWFTSTAFTRLEPKGVVIVIMTRWHDDDLAGRILSHLELSERCRVISFPAIATKDGKYRKQGEPLWKDKYPVEALMEIKNTIGPYDWSALYMGSPVLTENQEFKPQWIKTIKEEDVEKMSCRRNLTIDTAMSKSTQADYTGFVDNRINSENFWHIKAWRLKLGPEELVDILFSLHESNRYDKIGIEKTAYLEGLKPFLDSEQRRRGRFLPIVELEHKQTSKEIRIRGLIPRYASGSVYHIENQCSALEEEQISFPFGTNDDVLDAEAYHLQISEKDNKSCSIYRPQWKSFNRK